MIFEINMTIVAEDVHEAHEAATQLADSRGSVIQEIEAHALLIEGVDTDPINGFALELRMTPGKTPSSTPERTTPHKRPPPMKTTAAAPARTRKPPA